LKLRDQSGTALIALSLNDDKPAGPFLLLSDPQHKAGLSISILEGAGSQLTLTGARADIQAHIGVTPDGTTLALSDLDGFTTNIGSGIQAFLRRAEGLSKLPARRRRYKTAAEALNQSRCF
jgi:hypothetical protein